MDLVEVSVLLGVATLRLLRVLQLVVHDLRFVLLLILLVHELRAERGFWLGFLDLLHQHDRQSLTGC